MRRSITTRFLIWFAALSVIFLVAGSALSIRMSWTNVSTRLRDQLQAEAKSAATIASQSYSIGDLVALRSTLNQLALTGSWSRGSFANTSDEIMWSVVGDQTKSGESPRLSYFARIASAMVAWFAPAQTTLATKVPVTMSGGSELGMIQIEKIITEERAELVDQIVMTLTSFAAFWLVFVILATSVIGLIVLRPILSLKQAIAAEAQKHGIALSAQPYRDELGQIEGSFQELANAWVNARQEVIRVEKLAAVARMTQMLAHDVRKPFSIFRVGLGMIRNARDFSHMKQIVSNLIPAIDKSVASVDGLIADVMEVGATSTQLIQEPASPESLIEATLGEMFRVYPKANVAVAYALQHKHMANVHVQKVGRVFSNIVGNAIQAINYEGEIWFKTQEVNGMIEFGLGNAGSVIPPENLSKLFDAFFTSGKKGGTGLGLAIAEKIVKAHGGRIWCESGKTLEHPDGFVEFRFTLPMALQEVRTTAILPKHSSEVMQAIRAMTYEDSRSSSVDHDESVLEGELSAAYTRLGRPIKVLVVDDEAVYRNALTNYLSRTDVLDRAFSITQTSSSQEALSVAKVQYFDLIITDVDLGPTSANGFVLVKELRTLGQGLLCVHSNRMVQADQRTAMEGGADAFIPKPIARGQLLKLALQATRLDVSGSATPAAPVASKPVIAVADDNPSILDAWVAALQNDATVIVADSPEDLLANGR